MRCRKWLPTILAAPLLLLAAGTQRVPGQSGEEPAAGKDEKKAAGDLVPLNKQGTVLLDREGKRVVLKTKVVNRDCALEMLLCPFRTKEHESILGIDARAYVIHTGLLALGVEPGRPASFVREVKTKDGVELVSDYRPPEGPRIEIFVQWKDKKDRLHREPARKWVRYMIHRFYTAKIGKLPGDLKIPEGSELRYDGRIGELIWFGPMTAEERDKLLKLSTDEKYRAAIKGFYSDSQPRQLDADWIFTGSIITTDPETGKSVYHAEQGDLICVANFPTAMIDLDMKSSASKGDQLFEAWTERIPPEGTEVTVELIPRPKEKSSKKGTTKRNDE